MELGLICPEACGAEAAWAGDTRILAAPSLIALVNHFRGTQMLSPPQPGPMALTGGGLKAKPGEVSLAHNGALDSLRQPLETGEVIVARANAPCAIPRGCSWRPP